MVDNKLSEDAKEAIDEGQMDADVYSESGREELEENDEISAEEEGFMKGEEEAENEEDLGNCSDCGKELSKKNVVNKEIRGNLLHFCSNKCLKDFTKKEDTVDIIFGDEEASDEPSSNKKSDEESEDE